MCMMRERREEGAGILDMSWRMAVTSVVSGSEGSWIVTYLAACRCYSVGRGLHLFNFRFGTQPETCSFVL